MQTRAAVVTIKRRRAVTVLSLAYRSVGVHQSNTFLGVTSKSTAGVYPHLGPQTRPMVLPTEDGEGIVHLIIQQLRKK